MIFEKHAFEQKTNRLLLDFSRSSRARAGPIRAYMGPYGSISALWAHMGPYGPYGPEKFKKIRAEFASLGAFKGPCALS